MNRPATEFAPESATPARFTAEQFLRMVDLDLFPDENVELVHGEIIELSPAHSRHGRMIVRVLKHLLAAADEDRCFVDAFIQLDEMSVRAFDITVTKEGVEPDRVLKTSEVLLGIEVSGSSIKRDLGSKMRHYASAGIDNYLVVDLTRDCVHLMQGPSGDKYGRVIKRKFGEMIELPGDLGPIVLD